MLLHYMYWYLLYANYNDNCPVVYYRLNVEHNTHTHTRLVALFPGLPG